MATLVCEQRIGFGSGRHQGEPVLCKNPATVSLANQAGKARLYCDTCLTEYRSTWNMSMGTEQAKAFFASHFTVTPIAEEA